MSGGPDAVDRTDAVPTSGERFAEVGGGVRICYQTFGTPTAEPLLLVMGLGGPMTWWDTELCERLAAHGFFVIRYDNRDTGRSTRIRVRVRRSVLLRAMSGRRFRPPYSLTDMAADAFGLLDRLGIDAAHVAGVSMGGMIAQTMAIERPQRVRSLTSIMSTVGRRNVGFADPRLMPMMLARRPHTREAYLASAARTWRAIGSPAYPQPRDRARRRAEEKWDRGYSAVGVLRQLLAVLAQPDRTAGLAGLRMPVTVVHGWADRLVHVSGGKATARAVPRAELVLVPGMGHDMPPELFGLLADTIARTARRSLPATGPISR